MTRPLRLNPEDRERHLEAHWSAIEWQEREFDLRVRHGPAIVCAICDKPIEAMAMCAVCGDEDVAA